MKNEIRVPSDDDIRAFIMIADMSIVSLDIVELLCFVENPALFDDDINVKIYVGDAGGWIIWLKNGTVCREDDRPAIIFADGTRQWHDENGMLHRESNEPALIRDDCSKEWWQHGLLIKKEK